MKVKIIKCSRINSWYEPFVGQWYPVIGFDGTEFEALEPSGHRNFILAQDVEVYLFILAQDVEVE